MSFGGCIGVISSLYYKLHKESFNKAILKFKRIPIEVVFKILTKNCWMYGIQYEVIIKDRLTLEIKLEGNREKVFLKFDKAMLVVKEDYEKFLNLVDTLEVDRAYFITTGVFQGEIYKSIGWNLTYPKIVLEDNRRFIKRQVWKKSKYNEHLKYDKLDFCRYLPI